MTRRELFERKKKILSILFECDVQEEEERKKVGGECQKQTHEFCLNVEENFKGIKASHGTENK